MLTSFIISFSVLLFPQDNSAGIPLVKLDRKDPIDFKKEIAPIFANKCIVCHAGADPDGNYNMTTPASLLKGGKRGAKVIVPGDAEASFLWASSAHRVKPIMPPKSEDNPLTPLEVTLIKTWIDEGAKVSEFEESLTTKLNVVLDFPPALVKPIRGLAFAPNNQTLFVSQANRLLAIDTKTGELSRMMTDATLLTRSGKPADVAHVSLIEALALSPDGKQLAVGSFREVTLWDTATGSIQHRLAGLSDNAVALAYAPDGSQLAVGGGPPSQNGELLLFDPTIGKQLLRIEPSHSDTVYGVSFSPDGTKLASAGADKFVKVWEIPSGTLAKSFEGHSGHVLDVAWSPDGKRLMSASADQFLKVWDLESGEKLRDIQGFKNQITRLARVPNLPDIVAACGDGTARTYTADGNQGRAYTEPKDFLYAVAVSPDGTMIALAGEQGTVRLYERPSGKLLKTITPPTATPTK